MAMRNKKLSKQELKAFLDAKVVQYNARKFIESDPIQIPHQFNTKEDIEISGFLTATISWGNRKSIINNANRLMELLDRAPFDFIMNHNEADLEKLQPFVHRTFNGNDCAQFIKSLQHIYNNHNGLESLFATHAETDSLQKSISHFKSVFFEIWMVRDDKTGVDFGIWNQVNPSQLSCPLDVHSGNVARKLGLLKRKQNDGKALLELDTALRKLDPTDPVKYDFALFGLGVFEGF